MVNRLVLPLRSRSTPLRPTGDQRKGKTKAFKLAAGTGEVKAKSSASGKKARSSPFKKMFASANDNEKEKEKARTIVPAEDDAEDDARVEISQDGDRDELEQVRDMYDHEAGESRTLNTLSHSLSLESGTVDDESHLGSLLSETIGESLQEECVDSFDAPEETMHPQGEIVKNKSVVLSNLKYANEGNSLALRSQLRLMQPEKETHAFIHVKVRTNQM